jgi:hypothetical protein
MKEFHLANLKAGLRATPQDFETILYNSCTTLAQLSPDLPPLLLEKLTKLQISDV